MASRVSKSLNSLFSNKVLPENERELTSMIEDYFYFDSEEDEESNDG